MHTHNDTFTYSVDEHEFKHKVIAASHKQPILVDFWADWCAPCISIAPILAEVVKNHKGSFHLAKVEVDEGENMKLAGHYKLRGFPTLILFINGEEVDRFASHRPRHWIEEFLAKHI